MEHKTVNIELLETYARIKRQIKALETEDEMVKGMVMEHMKEIGQEKITTEYGYFDRQSRKNYKYSEAVKKLEDRIKKTKNKEIEDGIAECSETHFLTFRLPTI